MKILIPIDGSETALHALDALLRMRTWYQEPVELHLLNVQHGLHQDVGQFVGGEEVRRFHYDEGLTLLAPACAKLDQAGVAHAVHIGVGERAADTIVHFAHELGIDQIVMGSHGRSGLTHLLLGSVTSDVIRQTDIPVMLVK